MMDERPFRLRLPPPSIAPLHLAQERVARWRRQREAEAICGEAPQPARGRFPYFQEPSR